MRTTLTLDDDVVALIDDERRRTGESFRTTVNRLLRRGSQRRPPARPPPLPIHPGRPQIDIRDVSVVLATLDEERRAQRGLL